MLALSLIIVALALVLGGNAGSFVDVLWWVGISLGMVGAIRMLTATRRERLQPDNPLDGLGGIPDLMQRRRIRRVQPEVRAEWSSSD